MLPIETPRLLIRAMQPADVEPLAALWSDPEVTRYLGGPRQAAELRANFHQQLEDGLEYHTDLWPVIEKTSGRLVGHCGLLDKEIEARTEFEIVYVLAREAWGLGYASEAAAAIREAAFGRLRLYRLVALIEPENAASARVAEKIGMHCEREIIRPGGKIMRLYALERQAKPDPFAAHCPE